MDTNFEQIIPWNGAQDTGYDVRMKWMRNFAKIAAALTELDGNKEQIEWILQELKNFLRKDREDETNYLLRMLGGAHFFPFVQGMVGGSGAAFYKNAAGKTYMEADGAYLRDELIVPQITFNCIDVISGDKANTFAFGTIKSVDTENRTAELDLLEDQTGTLHVDDICRGVFHNLDGSNLQDDMEDDNGFYGYAGFSTSYFTPTEITESAPGVMKFRYNLQAGTSVHPMKGMNFFAYGNFTDKTRQSITYETRYYTRRLKDVNTWVIDPTKNISMQDGLLEGLTIGGMVMHGYGTFQENCYFTGVNIQFTPDTEEALKGESAYNVSLSSYERVVKMDDEGNIVSLLEALNVTTGNENVVTGDLNVITTQKKIQTHVQAFKGKEELLYSTSVEEGTYIVTLSPQGCTASVDAGIVSIDSITARENCFVDIQVNCEGFVVFDKRFSVSIIRDGSDVYTIDLDNEMASVACDTEGNVTAGLPVTSGVAFYKGTKALSISKVVTDAPAGVTCGVDEDTHSVTVSAIGKDVAESFCITVTVTADDEGVPVTRSTVMTVLKMKAGENATLYRLVPSVNVVKIDKEGNYSESYIACSVMKTDGKSVEILTSLPEDITMSVRRDGLAEKSYSLNDDIATDGLVRSVEFRLKKGDVLIDAETVPFVADGMDGSIAVIADLDNEVASVACDAEGNVTAGLPIVSVVSLYYGAEAIALDSLLVEKPAGVTVSADKSSGKVTVSAIADYTPDAVSVPVTCTGTFGGQSYERTVYIKINKVKPGADGKNAVIYQLLPSLNVIKVNKNGSYVNSSISCGVTKNDGGTVSTVASLPSGLRMTFQRDNGSETSYTRGSSVSVVSASEKVSFRLYNNNVLADMETVPVVKDGTDGKDGQDGQDGADGRPGSDGADGKQGIQGCVIRVSIWASGREYRNDSVINDDSIIRYIDVAMQQNNNYSTGWEAHRCKKTHTASSLSGGISFFNTEYWEEFTDNVSAIFTDLIIAKNAQIAFMQGNRLLIVDDDNGITAGLSGNMTGDKIRIWAGSQMPDDAPFRVDYKGRVWATDGTFAGDLSARSLTLQRNTSTISGAINGALIGLGDTIGRFPELSGKDVKVIELVYPLMSRTITPVTLRGINSNVILCPDGDRFNASDTLLIDNIQGCYYRCIGSYSGGKTYWDIFPMNEGAKLNFG